jgi:preprotein translocase subunit SecF|tara:strand:- start:6171 stop:7289 length:1119 start_codon:yes stop_codon:yes gene_type:complete
VIAVLRGLYAGETVIDFPRWWRVAALASGIALLLSLGSFGLRGLELGIDFAGGTSYEVAAPDASVSDARSLLSRFGADGARIQVVDGDMIRIRSDIDDPARAAEIRDALSTELGPVETFEQVGPTWGDEVTDKAVRALVVFFLVVALYISARLEWKMAAGALAAVAHDIVVSVGVYSLLGVEVTPATVIAFLTIMGYSLYDTIVVYDKVREMTGRLGATERYTYTELMNLALNRVAMRSINTSVTSALPVLSLLMVGSVALGATALREFALALLVGIIVGSYSSLFLAAAMVARLKEGEQRWVQIRSKLAGRGLLDGPTRTIRRDEASAPDSRSSESPGRSKGPARRRPAPAARPGGSGSGTPPRPRKKRRN